MSHAVLPFTTNPNHLLCIGDPQALRERWDQGPEWLQTRRRHLIQVARHAYLYPDYHIQHLHLVPEGLVRPMTRPDEMACAALAYVITGETDFAASVKQILFELADGVEQREHGDWAQCHTWCDAFPFARWVVYYDWVYDSKVFSEDDHAYLQERLLYYLWAHPATRLRARPIEGTACNNQNAAMGFACVAGGALFGLKRDHNPRALRLLHQGLPHLVRFATAFPLGGYSFEGSTYMGHVNAFAMPLIMTILADLGLDDLDDARHDDTCASPRETFAAIMRLTMPGGLMLPWDNYGYAPATFGPAAAYYARISGDTAPLKYLIEQGNLDAPTHVGWGFDPFLWTLLYAPETEATDSPAASFCHAEPSIGAGATGPETRLFVYQMWDRAHWPPGRAQFNPNSLLIDYDGSPLLIDGRPVELSKKEECDHERFSFYRTDIGCMTRYGVGTAAAHNCIFFDGQEEVVPHRSTEGTLISAAYTDGLALFEADVTDCYADAYDVAQVRRATLVVDDAYTLVRDRVSSATEHTIQWRIHTREGSMSIVGRHAELAVHAGPRLSITALEETTWVHRYFSAAGEGKDNSAVGLEPACHELTREATGSDIQLYTAFIPQASQRPLLPLNGPWDWCLAPSTHEAVALLADWPGGQPVDPSRGAWFYQTDEARPGVGVYRRTLQLDELPDGQIWLKLPCLTRSTIVQVNGQQVTIELGWETPEILPSLVPVRDYLVSGENTLALIVPSTLLNAIHGPVSLVCEQDAVAATASQIAPDTFEITGPHGTDLVVWADDQATITSADGTTRSIQAQPAPAPDTSSTCGPDTAMNAILAEVSRAYPEKTPSEAHLLAEITSGDWRRQVAALQLALKAPTPAIVEQALIILKREITDHRCLYRRDESDILWYRLKAVCARLLGAARCTEAVEILGQLLLSDDFYPGRVAASEALQQIATPEAETWLNQVPANEEFNVSITTRLRTAAPK